MIWVQGAGDTQKAPLPTLEQARAAGADQSKYTAQLEHADVSSAPETDLVAFQTEIQPILEATCYKCHGEKKQKGDFRIDTLDPNLVHGEDVSWWLEVVDVLSNGEMPPEDEDEDEEAMAGEDRGKVVDWLSSEIQLASQVRRSEGGHSSFRRMTRYEYGYALQDLLSLPQDFAKELLPEAVSEDGFQNSSEMLQMTSQQFATYRDVARKALKYATVRGAQPDPVFFAITMDKAGPHYLDWVHGNLETLNLEMEAGLPPEINEQAHRDMISGFRNILSRMEEAEDPKAAGGDSRRRRGGGFLNRETGESWNRRFPYGWSVWEPSDEQPVVPEVQPIVMELAHGGSQQVDLGDHLPERGLMKIRFRANRASSESDSYPSLRLGFGYRPSNNARHDYTLSKEDIAITAPPGKPEFYEWTIPIDDIKRNPFRGSFPLHERPNISEYITLRNVHQGAEHTEDATVHIDYIEVIAPFVTQWPPESHRRVFTEQAQSDDETANARQILENFMPKAWRRAVSDEELEVRLELFQNLRPLYSDFQETMIEVIASVLASPNFIYLAQSDETITDSELASRLSFFLWSSQPDDALLQVATSGGISDSDTLVRQAKRMLADPRADRFAEQFTYQWLGMELLDFFKADEEAYPNFSDDLKTSMQREPIEFFQYLLNEDRSIMDFLHSDYALLNQSLAEHYGVNEVFGNHFQKVSLAPEDKRGGLLAQAGLLAMNSDGKDSHPLKRGIWVLESLLNDPPPPPPPAVPEIDLTDPEILKMTLKERMEDHRNDPACMSCHAKIDPWGIAFEEFDAIGSWRDQVGGKPVDATSFLYNKSELAGMDGLKRYLLENRQDQFARAMVHKLASYALGRPLSFADRAEVERITTKLRQEGDGLRTLILLLVESDLFRAT